MSKLPVVLFVVLSCLVVGVIGVSAEHGTMHAGEGKAKIRVEDPAKCTICGMDRRMFAHSRAMVTFEDSSTVGTCSISCAHEAVDKHAGKKVKLIQVADYSTKQLIAANTSVWVIGGSKKGVMTSIAKWAFAERSGAERFVQEFGGKVTGFDEVWRTAAD
jgi:nitrous oxide reductase accessory protein NosL